MDQSIEAPAGGAPLQVRSGEPEKARRVRPVEGRWSWFKYTQIGYLILSVASITMGAVTLNFFDKVQRGAFVSDAELMAEGTMIDTIALPLGYASIASYLICAVFYAMFYHRCMNNLHAEGSADATMPPGWVWGYFFIPFINLFKPVDAIMQIWRGSMRLSAGNPKEPATIGWWWATWLIGNFAGTIGGRLNVASIGNSGDVDNFELFKLSIQVILASNVITAICVLLLLRFSFQIKQAQVSIRTGDVSSTFS